MKKNIEVVPYNPLWPSMFSSEAIAINQALGNNCLTIHHIGSTSIPGLSAKPIIDMLPVVKDIQEVDNAKNVMEILGYEAKGEHGIAFRRFFQKKETYNVHVYQEDDPEISRYLKFRDWMRSHPTDAVNYAKLKTELAAKFPQDMLSYCNGKDLFVASIDAKDGFEGWRMVQALTEREWSAANNLRQQYFLTLKKDPFLPFVKNENHIHFVLYKNAEIIGYAHLQLLPEKKAILQLLVIDDCFRNLGFENQFLKLCERWLCHQNIQLSKSL